MIEVFHKMTGEPANAVQFNGANNSEVASFLKQNGISYETFLHNGCLFMQSGSEKHRLDESEWLVVMQGELGKFADYDFDRTFSIKRPKVKPPSAVAKPKESPKPTKSPKATKKPKKANPKSKEEKKAAKPKAAKAGNAKPKSVTFEYDGATVTATYTDVRSLVVASSKFASDICANYT